MRLTLELDAPALAAATDTRRVAGILVPYGTPGRTSIGDVTVRAGAIRIPDQRSRVRLLRGHDRDAPIGVLIDADDTPEALRGTFSVARTAAGDDYLAELDPDAPIRDGLSVELDNVTVTAGEVTAADLIACAAVPLPAYPDARAALAAEHNPENEEPTVPDDTTTDAGTPAPTTADTPPATMAAALAPALPPMTAARTRPVSYVAEMAQRLTAARMDGNSALQAALADITPAGNGAGNEDAGLMTQALGELWEGVAYRQRYIGLVLGGNLTGSEVEGWRWAVPPVVAPYTGNKADVPSNAAKLEKYTVPAERLAGAHDIDRIYRDLASADVLASYWRHMAESLAVQLDTAARDLIVNTATGNTNTGGTASTAMGAIVAGTLEVSAVANPSYALVSGDLIEAMALETSANAPVGPPMALPPIVPAPGLTAGTVIVGTKQAARLPTLSPPVRVEAVNIPNGGIDAGLYSYYAPVVELADGFSAWTVA